ncbi:MAG: beta-lactamase family protein [Planctomycetes bacterium]|nr:beta-lactamase family protein [Planctomycetota bacterium]
MLELETPRGVGLDPARWDRVLQLLHSWCETGALPAAGICVTRGGKTTGAHLFGQHSLAPTAHPIADDAIFLIASITKPIVACGILLLVERGLLALDDRVEEYVPLFRRKGNHGVTLRHLLTHTSGLPDMLANNLELRAAQAPLSAFVEGACQCPLDFVPGTGVQYQSMGFALLGEIIQRVTGQTCGQFLDLEFFQPLGMQDTALGAPDAWFTGAEPKIRRVTEVRIPEQSEMAADSARDWNWNSRYWRQLGVPWGGLLTTPLDLARFGQMLLSGGQAGGRQILSRASIQASTRNQLDAMREVPADDRRTKPWGLGWRLNWPAHSANFGDLLGPRTYGHWGATGTLMWIDPDRETCAVLLTTQPQEPAGSYLARASNAMAAALL